jgi:uncharacterized protein UPF0236
MKRPEPKQPAESEREARIQRILQEIEKKLRTSLPDPEQTLEQIEQEVVEIGEEIREVIERESVAPWGTGYLGSHTPCACGQAARYVAAYRRQIVTLNGVLRLARAYYYCEACRKGFCPLDRQRGIGRSQSSVGVRALAARFGSYLPFEKAAEEMALVTGVRLSARTVAREARAVGEALMQEWQEREARLFAGQAPTPSEKPKQAHVEMDGVQVPIGKGWQEAKIGTVFETGADGKVKGTRYYATLAKAEPFGRRMRTLGREAGLAYCPKLAGVGDGAEWIWQEMAKHFPQAVPILDFYHVMEHLWVGARACLREEPAQREWIHAQAERLLRDEVKSVIAEIEAWEPTSMEASEVQRKLGNYLREHQAMLTYQSFRREGYHIGSGVAEASCKNVVQARVKGVGMRWSEPGAGAMLHLRAAVCSAGRTDFLAPARRATIPS